MIRSASILLGIAFVSAAALAATDQMPRYDVTPSCRAAVVSQLAIGRTMQTCMKDEDDARDQLTKQWTQFPPAERDRCAHLASMGGSASYVELLTCLEMAREVRNLHEKQRNDSTGTTGMSGSAAPKRP